MHRSCRHPVSQIMATEGAPARGSCEPHPRNPACASARLQVVRTPEHVGRTNRPSHLPAFRSLHPTLISWEGAGQGQTRHSSLGQERCGIFVIGFGLLFLVVFLRLLQNKIRQVSQCPSCDLSPFVKSAAPTAAPSPRHIPPSVVRCPIFALPRPGLSQMFSPTPRFPNLRSPAPCPMGKKSKSRGPRSKPPEPATVLCRP